MEKLMTTRPSPNLDPAKPMSSALQSIAESWPQDADFVCRTCGEPARKEPAGEDSCARWGCANCGFTTINPSISFTDAVPA